MKPIEIPTTWTPPGHIDREVHLPTTVYRDAESLTSVWMPNEDERRAIALGGPVVLTFWNANAHPVVSLTVGEAETSSAPLSTGVKIFDPTDPEATCDALLDLAQRVSVLESVIANGPEWMELFRLGLANLHSTLNVLLSLLPTAKPGKEEPA